MNETLLNSMTLEEKCSLLSGESFWHTQALPRLGIPSIMLTDGPHGLRKQQDAADHLGLNLSVEATCFPPAVALASSWDPSLVYAMGEALADECIAENVSVLLGPGANIKRSPLCGRNFEYFSEDPYLSSHMAKNHILGLQSKGIAGSIKHFVANNQETKRLTLNVELDERTLREIYLASFEIAIKEGKPYTIMSAYNQLNGKYGAENKEILHDILRDEWGYDGLVVTDWGGTNQRVDGLLAGLDLEMPSSGGINDQKVLDAVKNGTLDEKYVDRAVLRLLDLIERTKQEKTIPFQPEKNKRIAENISADCVVLLKNQDNILPLNPQKSIGVIGDFAVNPRFQGGGSSHINPTFMSKPWEELQKHCKNIKFATGFRQTDQEVDGILREEALQLAKEVEILVVFAGLPERFETEGLDRTHLNLPQAQNQIIEALLQVNPNIIVVLSNGSPVYMPWANQVKGILEAYLLGSATGYAVTQNLLGFSNPSGKLAETFPKRLEDTPCYLNFPGYHYQVSYKEGIFVGYRHYDALRIDPLFEFGFGLSYTTFTYENLRVDKSDFLDTEEVLVSLEITNSGACFGKEVVQLYVKDHTKEVQRPEKELKGFEKVALEPGEKQTVSFKLNQRSFAYYNATQKNWVVESGVFTLMVGASSRDIRQEIPVNVTSTSEITKTFHRNSTFGEIYHYPRTNDLAKKYMDYFEKESGIDFALGDNQEDFAFRVICDFPLKTLVTFTKGKFSEKMLDQLLTELNESEKKL